MRSRAIFFAAAIVFVAVVLATGASEGRTREAAALRASEPSGLIRLAETEFPSLTRAERALLEYADVSNTVRGEYAVAGPSPNPDDPSNDPKSADEWGAERQVRASLIRWLCVTPRAVAMVDPGGIRLLGARIIGSLNLSYVHLPFAITARRCAIPETIGMVRTEIPHLCLDGSYIGELDGKGLVVHGDLDLGEGFHSSGEILVETSKIDGDLNLGGAHIHHSKVEMSAGLVPYKVALDAVGAVVGGATKVCCGFESEGAVAFTSASLNQGLLMWGAHLSNPNNLALNAGWADIGGVALGGFTQGLGGFEADGRVDFSLARVKSYFQMAHAKFGGAASENPALFAVGSGHGLFAGGMTVDGPLILTDVRLENGAVLDLTGVKIAGLVDEEKSWPEPGRLLIGGFTYEGFVPGAPTDADSRLRWLALQPGFHSQPYRQLAHVLRENGDDAGAVQVLVAEEDARYARFGPLGRLSGGLLKVTIGYGHRPLLTVMWSLAAIVLGWGMVWIGKRARLMRPTWPENAPEPASQSYEELHPLLYSIDAFFPFVNLHQEHYWWPDSHSSVAYAILGHRLSLSGRALRYWLWFEIGAGWLLSAIFLAGVTGLIRSD